MQSVVTDPTRQRVARSVLSEGPVTAARLSADLGITPAAVRRHLDALEAAGLVRQAPLSARGRGPGRPARGWVATEAGHAAAPGAYDDLASAALAALEREGGRGALERFARSRAEELEARHRDAVEAAGRSPAVRAEALAAALASDGYAARARTLGGAPGGAAGVQLCQGHCPVQAVATRYPELCEAETDAFSRLLGAPVRRLATLAAGHHTCTTHVSQVPRSSAALTEGRTPARTSTTRTSTTQTTHADQPGTERTSA